MKSKAVKKAAKRVTAKQKPGRRPDPANVRVATRLTENERRHMQALAIHARRTDSAFIRELIVAHLEENPPPKE